MIDKNDKKLNFISIEKATTPFEGAYIMKDRYWSICPDRGLIFFKPDKRRGYGSPQCNSQEATAIALNEKLYPWSGVAFIGVVYLEHHCEDYL